MHYVLLPTGHTYPAIELVTQIENLLWGDCALFQG